MISQARPAPLAVIYITVIKSVISPTKTQGNRAVLMLKASFTFQVNTMATLESNKHSLQDLF